MINRLTFSVDIKAQKTKIWETLWSDMGYRDWAGVFYQGSYAVTDNWTEGSRVHFLIPDQSGIYSHIEKHAPNEMMSFKHIGNVLKGKEQPIDKETEAWSGALETYSLAEGEEYHTLNVEIDIMDEHLDYMQTTFPKALEKIKHNCEQ